MKLELKKFGTTLTSRQSGREAYNAIRPTLEHLPATEVIKIDFDEVVTFSPSWADEFLTPLQNQFTDRVRLEPSTNPAVAATLELLNDIRSGKL